MAGQCARKRNTRRIFQSRVNEKSGGAGTAAATSTPAVYELFGDRAGLVRELFFHAFRQLGDRFDQLGDTGDPRADLTRVIETVRGFVVEHPALGQLMFSRPFADFDPGPRERSAGDKTRRLIVARVRRCIDAGLLAGEETDIAHVLLALVRLPGQPGSRRMAGNIPGIGRAPLAARHRRRSSPDWPPRTDRAGVPVNAVSRGVLSML